MNRKILLAGVVLVGLAVGVACRRSFRRLKPLKAAESALLTDAKAAAPAKASAVNGEALAPSTAWLKDATSEPKDPLAAVAAGRLAQTPAPAGALDNADALAALCVQASVACGFELSADVWKRPEARVNFSGVTAADALTAFAGKDYRFAWIGAVAHVFPAAAGASLPLDAPLSADVSMNSLSREPAETIHEIAVKLGLTMPAPRPRSRRSSLVGASTMPIRNSARYILDYLTRPAILHPHTYIAVGASGAGSLRWYWGEPPPW